MRRNRLSEWIEAFAERSRCPWPGPRPLDDPSTERELLVLREGEVKQLLDRIDDKPLVLLLAETGTGKSSFLNVGATPALEEAGFKVVVCGRWDFDREAQEARSTGRRGLPEDGISRVERSIVAGARKSRPGLPDGIDPTYEGLLVHQLNREYGSDAIVVLDQFEELIRYRRDRFVDAMNWISRAIHETRVKVVVSLRKEYVHELDPLRRVIGASSLAEFSLKRLASPAAIKAVIAAPPGDPIKLEAIDLLVDLWKSEVRNPLESDLGLLDVQATLFVLHREAQSKGLGAITKDVVGRLVERAHDDADLPGSLFRHGLRSAAQQKLQDCVDSCNDLDPPLDDYLVEGTRTLVVRAIPQLSSGGYKVPKERWELASHSLSRELELLGYRVAGTGDHQDAQACHDLFDAMCDLGDDLLACDVRSLEPQAPAAVLGPRAASSGVMMDEPAEFVLAEELRRAVFAGIWLEQAQLVRMTSTGQGQTMLSLIHDGFGGALRSWADAQDPGPRSKLHLLTAARGETFDWDRPPKPAPPAKKAPAKKAARGEKLDRDRPPKEFDGHEAWRVIVNLRWRECRIRSAFRRVQFVNCDFTSSTFYACSFEGVTFVNCLLDGATFRECTLVGEAASVQDGVREAPGSPLHVAPDDTTRGITRLAPSFWISEAEPTSVGAFSHYHPVTVEDSQLFSPTPGVRAFPRPSSQKSQVRQSYRVKDVPLAAGGLTVTGGRINSLMLYRCFADRGGAVEFHSVSGTGLDVIEHEEGDVVVHDCAIRGLSFSRDVHDYGPDGLPDQLTPSRSSASDPPKTIRVRISDSWIVNVVFSANLVGSAEIVSSNVWNVINGNADDKFQVRVGAGCRWLSLLGTREPGAEAAATLGISEDVLAAALGDPTQGPPDLQAAAAKLGITAREVGDALCIEELDALDPPSRVRARPDIGRTFFEVADVPALAAAMEKMDYRFDPARFEDAKRRAVLRDGLD